VSGENRAVSRPLQIARRGSAVMRGNRRATLLLAREGGSQLSVKTLAGP